MTDFICGEGLFKFKVETLKYYGTFSFSVMSHFKVALFQQMDLWIPSLKNK